MTPYIHRSIEPALREMVGQFPVVAVTGPRQSGKSTLLQEVFAKYAYLTLDDPLVLQQALGDPELLLESAGPRVVIDEIQYAPSLLPRLKLRVDSPSRATGTVSADRIPAVCFDEGAGRKPGRAHRAVGVAAILPGGKDALPGKRAPGRGAAGRLC